MKTALKIFISIIIIGVILALVGLIIIDFDFKNLVHADDADYTLSEESTDAETNRVIVEADDRIIKFARATGQDINYTYYQSDDDKVTVSQNNGTLRIEAQLDRKWKWFNFSRVSPKVRTITISVPETFDGKIEVKTSNGSIYVNNLGTIESLDLRSSNGSIEVDKVSATKNSNLKTSNGTISVEDSSFYADLNMQTNNGKVKTERVIAVRIEGQSSNGNVNLMNTECNDITAKTSNGSVNISAKGKFEDYEVRVSTSNGTIRVNGTKVSSQTINSGQSKTIRATTSNGSIDVDFV